MAFAPEEIAEKEFTLGLRGYDKDEVRSYLRTVAEDLRSVIEASSADAADEAKGSSVADNTAKVLDTSGNNGSGTEGTGSTKVAAKAISSANGDDAAATPAPTASAAPTPEGTPDWSNLGEEIALVLRTAHEQANGLRSDAEAQAAAIRDQAQQEADASRQTAEKDRADAASALEKAQGEALGLVTEAQSRIDDRLAKAKETANREAEASVAGLTAQIGELTITRDEVRAELTTLRARLDDTLAANTVEPDEADETVSTS